MFSLKCAGFWFCFGFPEKVAFLFSACRWFLIWPLIHSCNTLAVKTTWKASLNSNPCLSFKKSQSLSGLASHWRYSALILFAAQRLFLFWNCPSASRKGHPPGPTSQATCDWCRGSGTSEPNQDPWGLQAASSGTSLLSASPFLSPTQ